jgi:hypothetical protein
MVLSGRFEIEGRILAPRDAVEITEILSEMVCRETGKLLLFIVPV